MPAPVAFVADHAMVSMPLMGWPAAAPAPSAKTYFVEMKVFEGNSQAEQVSCAPCLVVAEGQPAQVAVHDGLAYMLTASEQPEEVGLDNGIDVTVTSLKGDWVRLDLALQEEHLTKAGKNGFVAEGQTFHAVRKVKLGKKVKLAWKGPAAGKSGTRTWLEVTVRQDAIKDPSVKTAERVTPPACPATMPYCPAPLPSMPMAGYPAWVRSWPKDSPVAAPPASVGNYTFMGMFDMGGAAAPSMPNVAYSRVGLPVPPPAPACAVTPAMAALPIMPCGALGSMPMGPAATSLRATKQDGCACLQLQSGAASGLSCEALSVKVPGCGSLRVAPANDQVALSCPCMEAVADHVTMDQPQHVILEGHVRVRYHYRGQQGETSGDRIAIRLMDGCLEFQVGARK
jgi:hypothetical protein